MKTHDTSLTSGIRTYAYTPHVLRALRSMAPYLHVQNLTPLMTFQTSRRCGLEGLV